MIRSVSLINFKEDITQEQAQAVLEAYKKLPSLIDQVRNFEVALNAGLLEGAAGICIIADFDNEEDFAAYSVHPAQGEVIFPVCGPVMTGYSTIQYAK
jgi:hypothetical protein